MSAAAQSVTPQRESGSLTDMLVGLWCRILQTDAITEDSNFFDLGGDSLMAVNLFLEIERQTGRSLPITTIYDAPTIGELSALLEKSAAPAFSPLVLLKDGDASPPLFIVHGVGGTVIEFAALGKQIATRGPVYALQAQGLDGAEPPLESIAEMAALYCRAIREKQPNGPYWLCGYSFGGLVAVEMAKLLKGAGEEIALLLLIDAYAHPITWPRLSRLKLRARRTWHQLFADAGAANRHGAKALLFAFKTLAAKARSGQPRAPRSARLRDWLLDRNPNLPLPLLQTRLAGEAALSRYKPEYYPGNVVFLKAQFPDPEFPDDPKRIWHRLMGALEIHAMPGSHRTVITEHAASTAAQISACMRNAGKRDRTAARVPVKPAAMPIAAPAREPA
jgi:acetoacetyl-CoA synthetase